MRPIVFAGAMILLLAHLALAQPSVTIYRIPDGAVQPQASVDQAGIAHLIYLKGDPAHCDIFYIHSADDGATWSHPLRVNSQPGSAIAIGTVRGAHLAMGRSSRPHVAWMGSTDALPKADNKFAPMLYTRLNDDGTGFEPQRNLIAQHPGLDGGGSIAADETGNVYVGWHAPTAQGGDEQTRRVWIARSTDDGKTFATEIPVSDPSTGACGCCGMRMAFADGKLFVLYRSAAQMIHRGMYLLEISPDLSTSERREIAPMTAGTCIMSTAGFAPSKGRLLAAWETQGTVSWAPFDTARFRDSAPQPTSVHLESKPSSKHPALATNPAGDVLLAWAEGTGWNKGGAVQWQIFSAAGTPLLPQPNVAPGLPNWDCPAAFATAKGNFVLVY